MEEVMITVDGVAIPCPSRFDFGLQDVSSGESGRTEDALMHKNRIAQKRKIELMWSGTDWPTTATILQAFNPEYIEVRYPDMYSGQYETRVFYVGDRTAPVKIWTKDNKRMTQVSFNIIER